VYLNIVYTKILNTYTENYYIVVHCLPFIYGSQLYFWPWKSTWS